MPLVLFYRRTLLIVTPAYLDSEWCRFEYQVALQEMMSQKHKLLPVVVGDITELRDKMADTLDKLLKSLRRQGLVGILSHPERNRGIIKNPDVMWDVIEAGGLLQITAASLTGDFGSSCQEIAELAVDEGLIHFIASDAHDTKHRPFGMRDAYDTICEIAGEKLADLVCCENPARVFEGDDVKGGLVGKNSRGSTQKRTKNRPKQRKGFVSSWFGRS